MTGGGDVPLDEVAMERFYGSSGHNCGGRCVTIAEVAKGKIQRFLTDESKVTSDGTRIDPESRNFPQTRSCARCRSYKYRLYHPGRLLYPLKQTVKRGDLNGFKRITWEQALTEIATKHKKVIDKYGADGIYSIYAWGAANGEFQSASGGPLGAGGAGGAGGIALRYMGGAQGSFFGSYSLHQYQYFDGSYTGATSIVSALFFQHVNYIAKHSDNVVFWGDNSMSTANPSAFGYIKAVEDMKKRKPGAKVVFVGPEFSDTGVTLADEWVVSKPYTDPALIAGMIYYMLDNTFDLTTGVPKASPMLDIDYLDTMVYGFFDSPEYSLTEADGTIAVPANGNRVVPAVPAGRSYCSWLLGNNDKGQAYATGGNYTAAQFAGTKRWAPCSYTVKTVAGGSGSEYKTKQDFKTPKTPEWASAITGVPVEVIKSLATLYASNTSVTSTWSGGMQKQAEGIANLYALQALHAITKQVGRLGSEILWRINPKTAPDASQLAITVPHPNIANYVNNTKPEASCTAWHTAIKMAFADELKAGGYTGKYIPNFAQGTSKTPNVYWDDAGTKTFVQWERDAATGAIKTYSDGGDTFFDWTGRSANKPVYSGIRLMYNTGGNIFINQHENSNDSREMLESLKLNDFNDPDTFCLVSFDNFMSPTPRWSDYVLPAATSWEQQDMIAPSHAAAFYVPQVSTPPGEAKPTWDFANELIKTYEAIGGTAAGAATDFTGGVPDQTIESLVKKAFNTAKADPASPFSGMKWEDFLKNPYLPSKPDDYTVAAPTNAATMAAYNAANKTVAFIKPGVANNFIKTNEVETGGYGNEYLASSLTTAPKSSGRFQVFSPVLTWQYEHKFEKYHGYLPSAQRGQQHKDLEGDPFVLEIPVYYDYHDYFMEAYGGPASLNGLNFLLTTTHDRFRSHSSMAENPLLRELTHRVPGQDAKGHFKQGNDYGNYSNPATQAFHVNGSGNIPTLNSTINEGGTVDAANKDIASYSEIWINESDGLGMGLKDGDLVQVENPIGAVRVVARLTKRCAKGFVGLHQGCWYDPRLIDGKIVDVGGNCNTLMASQPSRIDHGNGQQSAMVSIRKVNA